ncbi:MAG: hypothetical protein V8S39_02755 [Lachnospiraceae bacterium]|nr:putative uncharacterized protein [Roseburia sp. CAG:303]
MAKQKKVKLQEYQYVNSLINNAVMDYRVYVMNPMEKIIVSIALIIIGGLVGLVFYGGLFKSDGEATLATYISNLIFFMIVGLYARKMFLPIYKNSRLKKRQDKLRKQFRDMMESLSASLSSGSNVLNAFNSALIDLKMQYTESDYIIIELQEIIDCMGSNVNAEEAMHFFGERSGIEDIQTFADVFEICYRRGGDMKRIVRRTYDVISDKMAINDEIETKLTSNKMQHNAMSVMPIAVVALLRVTNASFAESFATVQGVLVNTVAIVIFVSAYKYGKKIIDIKE